MRRRKWLALLLTVAMIATTLVTTGISSVFAADSGTYMYGDVDGDTELTGTDVGLIISNILGDDASLAKGTTKFAAANVDGDEELTGTDVGLIISKILGDAATFPADLDGDGYGPEGSVPHIATLEVSGEGGTATITNETAGTSAVASVAEVADVEDDAEVETAALEATQWTIEQYMADHPESNSWVDGETAPEGVDNACKTLMPEELGGIDIGKTNLCEDKGTTVFYDHDVLADDANITVTLGKGTGLKNHWHYKFNTELQMPCLQGTENPKDNGGKTTSFGGGSKLPVTGSFMVFEPHTSGWLYIRNVVFGGKTYGVVSTSGVSYVDSGNGYDVIETTSSGGGTIDSVIDTVITPAGHPMSTSVAVEVSADEQYYAYTLGSKIGIQGFTFVPYGADAPENDPNTQEKGEEAPTPTPFVKDPTFWRASENVTIDTKEMTNDALTFMTDMTYSGSSKTIDGESFDGYVSHAAEDDNGGWSDGAATGSALKFTAPSDGKITAYMTGVGIGKNFFIVEEGTETSPKTDPSAALVSFTPTDDTNRDFSLSCEVKSGKVYYAYVDGSRGRFCGLKFEAGGTVDPGETTAPTPTPDVNPTPTPDTPTPTPEETLPPLEDNQVRGVKGDKIVINSEPEPGYKVDTITVSDGTTVKFDTADKTVASFEMPSADVTVTVTFKLAGNDSYNAVVTADGGTAELSGEGVTPPAEAASVETAAWSDFSFVSVTQDETTNNVIYAVNGAMTEGTAEITLDAQATYGDANTMIFYNNNNNSNWKVGDVGYLLMKTGATIADTTDGLDAVVAVKVPYDSKLSVTTGGNGGHSQGLVYAQTGLGTEAKVIATIPDGKNQVTTSTPEEQYAAKKDDVVYIYCTDMATKFRSVEFIPDDGTDPTPPSPSASTEPEPTATTEPEPAGKTYTVKEGSTVTVTGTPDEAHAGMSTVVKVTTEDGAPVEVSADNTFVMPPQNVNVSVTFEKGSSDDVVLPDTVPAPIPTAAAANVITVDGSKETNAEDKTFKTVTEALAYANGMNTHASEADRIEINVVPGTYREQIQIDVPYLTIQKAPGTTGDVLFTWYYGIGYLYYSTGSDGYYSKEAYDANKAAGTVVENVGVTRWGCATRLNTHDFIAKDIVFENSFNRYVTDEEIEDGVTPAPDKNHGGVYTDKDAASPARTKDSNVYTKAATERAAAIAIEDDTDRSAFYNCKFLGSQDTLYSGSKANRIYFKDCTIQGQTDYMFGGNTLVFDDCNFAWAGYSGDSQGGHVTAVKNSSTDKGYLLYGGQVINGDMENGTYAAGDFGRPWGGKDSPTAVIGVKIAAPFSNTGWSDWSSSAKESKYYEYGSMDKDGKAISLSNRNCVVPSEWEALAFNPYSYLIKDGDSWDPMGVKAVWEPVIEDVEKLEIPASDTIKASASEDGSYEVSGDFNLPTELEGYDIHFETDSLYLNINDDNSVEVVRPIEGTSEAVIKAYIRKSDSKLVGASRDIKIVITADSTIDPEPFKTSMETAKAEIAKYFTTKYDETDKYILDRIVPVPTVAETEGIKTNITFAAQGNVNADGTIDRNPYASGYADGKVEYTIECIKGNSLLRNIVSYDVVIPPVGGDLLYADFEDKATAVGGAITDAEGGNNSGYGVTGAISATHKAATSEKVVYGFDVKGNTGATLTVKKGADAYLTVAIPTANLKDDWNTVELTVTNTTEDLKVNNEAVASEGVITKSGTITAVSELNGISLTSGTYDNIKVIDNEFNDGSKVYTTFWKASESDKDSPAGTMLMRGMTLMADANSCAGVNVTLDGENFTYYVSHSSANGGWTNGVAKDGGIGFKFVAPADGQWTVYITSLGGNKTFYIGSPDEEKSVAGTAGADQFLTIDVTGGKTYYATVSGSKGRFLGAKYVPTEEGTAFVAPATE